MSIKLSFCIPTLNRAALIGETLESIISQATDEVEIVIVDGASTDNTEEVVDSYRKQFSRIRYFRRETNMGVDLDMQESVKLARGKYCWLMSSDDILKPGAIDVVLKEMSDDYALIVVNSEIRSADLSRLLETKCLKIHENRIYTTAEHERLFVDTASYLSFMGAVVIKKILWDSREKAKYHHSDFIHIGVIFQKPLPATTLVIAEPLISMRYGNATWSSRSFEVSIFQWPRIIWSLENISDYSRSRVCPKEAWRVIKSLVYHRATGSYSLSQYKRHIRPRRGYIYSKLVAMVVAVVPGVIANILTLGYYLTIRRSETVLVNLRNSPFYVLRRIHRPADVRG